MNGYTPSTPLKTRLTNLLEQVPQELRNQAAADCMQDNPYDFERVLTSYVVLRNWETNPADTAQQIEREIDASLFEYGLLEIAEYNLQNARNPSLTPAQQDAQEAWARKRLEEIKSIL